MDDCIFCKIASGEIYSEKMFESDNFFVIKDINPKTKGHSLVISKKHYKTFLDMPSLLFPEFFDIVKECSLKLINKEKASGFNIVINNYKSAGQIVLHLHLHILPRYDNDGFKFGI